MKAILNIHASDGEAIGVGDGVTDKALTSNVATLTTASAHGLVTGDRVVVAGVDSTFDGTYAVASAPTGTTFTYAKTHANVVSAAATGTVSRVPTFSRLGTPEGRRGQWITLQNNGPGTVSYDSAKPADGSDLSGIGVTLAVNGVVTVKFNGDLYLSTTADATDLRYLAAG